VHWVFWVCGVLGLGVAICFGAGWGHLTCECEVVVVPFRAKALQQLNALIVECLFAISASTLLCRGSTTVLACRGWVGARRRSLSVVIVIVSLSFFCHAVFL